MASSQVIRMTLFKVPKEHTDAMVAGYKEVVRTQSKDGKPYILSLEAGPTYDDARNKGFTFVGKTVFKDMEDFEYYDKKCIAHKEFQTKAKAWDIQDVLIIHFTAGVSASLGA